VEREFDLVLPPCKWCTQILPTASLFVQNVLEELIRELAMPMYKTPFIVRMLEAIMEDIRRNYILNVLLSSSMSAGFLRFDGLANIRICNVCIGLQYLIIQIPQSKK